MQSLILGYLAGNSKLGSIPKVVLGGIVGWYAGKVSYYGDCIEKFKSHPHSKIGAQLRRQSALLQEQLKKQEELLEAKMLEAQSELDAHLKDVELSDNR